MQVKHTTQSALPNDPTKEISRNAWNEDHQIVGAGTAADADVGDFDAAGAAAAAQAASQPLDSDLTAIAALTTTAYGRAFLALADAAATRTAAGLGTIATQDKDILQLGVPASGAARILFPTSGANTGPAVTDIAAPLNSDLSINTVMYSGFNINGLTWTRIDPADKAIFWGLERDYLVGGSERWMEAYLQYTFADGFVGDTHRRTFMSTFDKTTNLPVTTWISGGSSLVLGLNDGTGTAVEKIVGKARIVLTGETVNIVGASRPTVFLTTVGTTALSRFSAVTPTQFGLTQNVSFNGATWNLDNTSVGGWAFSEDNTSGGEAAWLSFFSAGANPRSHNFRIFFDKNGNIGFRGTTSPTATLHPAAGTAAANTAPIKLTAGTNNGTPENGAFEYDGTNLYFTTGGVRKTVTLV